MWKEVGITGERKDKLAQWRKETVKGMIKKKTEEIYIHEKYVKKYETKFVWDF